MQKTGVASLFEALNGLLETPPVGNHLIRCPVVDAEALPAVDLVFARFREDEPDISSLAEFLAQQLVNYVVPLKKRREVIAASISNGGADFSLMDRLRKQAKSKFLELSTASPGRSSELGELLAYLIALEYLGAFQVASKMALKTSGNMPVYGLDGIHARFENGVMVLFFLESKLAGTAASGISDYVESMKEFAGKRKQYLLEYSIMTDLSNLDSLGDADRALALEYFDIYGSMKSSRLERSVGVICYSEKQLFKNKLPKSDTTPPSIHEDGFSKAYRARESHFRKLFANRLVKEQLDSDTHRIFLVATPDKNVLRDLFYKELMS